MSTNPGPVHVGGSDRTDGLADAAGGPVAALRTRDGMTLMASAGIGLLMAAHWPPVLLAMAPFFLIALFVPTLARRPEPWFAAAAAWVVAVVVQRNAMEDHVYLYIAWLVAVGVGLLDRSSVLEELRHSGRYLIATVFGVATLWKLISGSFLNGATLWTIALLDDRMAPMMNLAGISQDSFDDARPEVIGVLSGDRTSYAIELSSYSSWALVAISIATILIEAAIAIVHLAPDSSRLAVLRAPSVVIFGIVTYAVVPVLPFALLLSLIGIVIARFDRRVIVAYGVMVLVTVVRFLTL